MVIRRALNGLHACTYTFKENIVKSLLLCLGAVAGLSGCVAYADPYYGGYGYGQPAVSGYISSGPVYGPAPGGGRGRGHRDRDGVPNRYDRDRDGDGVPNRVDNAPNNPRRY